MVLTELLWTQSMTAQFFIETVSREDFQLKSHRSSKKLLWWFLFSSTQRFLITLLNHLRRGFRINLGGFKF